MNTCTHTIHPYTLHCPLGVCFMHTVLILWLVILCYWKESGRSPRFWYVVSCDKEKCQSLAEITWSQEKCKLCRAARCLAVDTNVLSYLANNLTLKHSDYTQTVLLLLALDCFSVLQGLLLVYFHIGWNSRLGLCKRLRRSFLLLDLSVSVNSKKITEGLAGKW